MQFQVPQNIDLEDKIIGPLTLKQFIILLVGGMFDYMWYTFFSTGVFILFAIPTTLFALALVFAKVHEEPFPKFLANLALFAIKPKILIWGKGPKVKIIETKKARKKEKLIAPKASSESEIQRLSQIIDTQGWSGSGAKTESRPEIPANPALSPIPKAKTQPKPFIEKFIKKPKAKKPQAQTQPIKIQPIQPKISQPQPIKTSVIQKPVAKPAAKPAPALPARPVIKTTDIKKIARELAKKEKTSQKKAAKAAKEISHKLKSTPPEKIKPKEPFWKKIIDKLPKMPETKTPQPPVDKTPQPSVEEKAAPKSHILATELKTPEDLERELGLGQRIKSHEAVKPKLNLGPASENNPEDPFEKVEP